MSSMKKMRIDPQEVTIRVRKEKEAARQVKVQLRALQPQEGSILLFRGLPSHIDERAFIAQLERSGVMPQGVSVLVLPENMSLEELPEEVFNSIGYYKREGDEQEE